MSDHKVSAKDIVKKWSRKVSPHDSDKPVWEVLDLMVSGLGNTRLPTDILTECIRTRDVGGLFGVADALDPQMYDSPAELLQDRLTVEAFKKFSFVNSPFNKREKAKIRFFEAEALCRAANQRVRQAFSEAHPWYYIGMPTERPIVPEHINWIIHYATRSIDALLGAFNLSELLGNSRFGPGSTLCVTGALTTEYFKFREKEPSVSTKCFPYAEALLNYDPKWCATLAGMHPLDVAGRYNLVSDEVAPQLRITDHNKVTFVPKNAKTERSIAIEPYFNLYFQLGVGSMIRRRLLKKFKIDLTSQKRNQVAAFQGSVDGKQATIDFSMASDTLAIETVRLLLPPEWFDHLWRLRADNYLLDRVIHPYHKFSSMGNGFTFELETLIFAALARGTHSFLGLNEDEISVFGDDVILSTDAASLFIEVCDFLGFRVNDEKSFLSGPFRESCGEDFLRGQRVRPVFCEELDTVRDVVSFSNRLLELNRSVDFCDWNDDWLYGIVDYLRGLIPRDVRQHVVGPPVEAMDTHLHTEDIELLAASVFVRWVPELFSWRYPTISFHATKFKRGGSALGMCLQNRLRGHGHFEDAYRAPSAFDRLVIGRRRELSPLREKSQIVPFAREVWAIGVEERARFEITGREVGEFKLGTGLRDGLLGFTLPCK